MTLSGIEIKYLINEISKRIVGYYVSNIYGITKDGLLFKLHHPEKQDMLLMFSTFGLWISSVKIDQIEPNKLLKRFRNDLLRLKLNKIEQLGDVIKPKSYEYSRLYDKTFSHGFRKAKVKIKIKN